jgi:hypothetical protein
MFKMNSSFYLCLAHEMNGNWYPWSLVSTPSEYVLAWHHVYNMLSSNGLDPTRLQWIWSVGSADVGQYKVEEYWVGENYTQWLGVDGYNSGASETWSHWQWPNEVFDDMLGRLRKLSPTKPISINEYGTSSIVKPNTTDVQAKNEWLNRSCDYLSASSDIKMASYFNYNDGPNDWMIFGGTHGDVVWNNFHAYSAYRNCLQSNEWIEPNITNPRHITDEQFAGRF